MKNNTINKEEVEKFSKIAEEWWNPNGKFKPLHKFNPIRIEYIKNNIIKDFNISSNHKPLKGISILDIGCGGGLLSEPLARLGAEVVGIDASKKNIDIAKHHLKKSNLDIEYHDKSPENFNYEKKFDVILGMYHDQVLTPIKTLFEHDAINITLGLPFIRISPDHGPNPNMLGKNKSDPSSFFYAMNFIKRINS